MTAVRPHELPAQSLLHQCRREGAYTDCYAVDVEGTVSHATYVEAFYTTALFRVERVILGWFARRPSTDRDARLLAQGSADRFAAWRVEARAADQLLLADFTGRTRSWLMSVPQSGVDGPQTLLYFGSAVLPVAREGTAKPGMGRAFHVLLGFHRLYSRLLLGAARSRVRRGHAAVS